MQNANESFFRKLENVQNVRQNCVNMVIGKAKCIVFRIHSPITVPLSKDFEKWFTPKRRVNLVGSSFLLQKEGGSMGKIKKSRKGIGGRKNKYYTHVLPRKDEIIEMCKTMTERQIARNLGIAYSTFNEYKKQFPEFSELLRSGREELVSDLKSALINRAVGFKYTEESITRERIEIPKKTMKMLEEHGVDITELLLNGTKTKTEIRKKQVLPDVTALNLALRNWDKEWANDPQVLELKKKELELREKQIENNSW